MSRDFDFFKIKISNTVNQLNTKLKWKLKLKPESENKLTQNFKLKLESLLKPELKSKL